MFDHDLSTIANITHNAIDPIPVGPYLGGLPQIYVYSATDGTQLATCDPLSTNTDVGALMNDITVIGNKAYATDSFNNKLMVMDVDEAINNGNCVVSELDLPDVFKAETDTDLGANGIVEYEDGLLVVHQTKGYVYHVGNLDGDPTYQEVIPAGGAVTGDSLNILDDKLYITLNSENRIGVFLLGEADGEMTATSVVNITSPEYKTPATSALYCGYIYSANGLFATHRISDEADDTVVAVPNPYDPCVIEEKSGDNKSPVPAPAPAENSSGFVAKYFFGFMLAASMVALM